jgi:photosystem II stability/assembly factor-like uncharacterized protein
MFREPQVEANRSWLARAARCALLSALSVLSGCSSGSESSEATRPNTMPQVVLTASASELSSGETIRLAATETDPAGGATLRSGSLHSVDGTVAYGEFVSDGQGGLSLQLSWDAMGRAAAISFEFEAIRVLAARLVDSTGRTFDRPLRLRLFCREAGASACGGRCLPIGGACDGGGAVCLAGQCRAGCFVDHVYYAAAAANPAESCQVCEPTRNSQAWSARADGISCAPGSACQAGRCTSGSLKIPTGISDDFSAIWGSGATDIYATTASGRILRTTNGWSSLSDVTPAGAMVAFRGVYGSGESQVLAVGSFGSIYRTTVSGSAWTQPASSGETLYAIWGSGNVFYAVGANGSIVKSSDGGQSWVSQISTTTEVLRGVFGIGTNQVVAAGDNGVIVRTSDGSTWSHVTSGVPTSFFAVTAIDATTFFACGSNAVVLRSDNGGQTWQATSSLAVVGNARSLWGSSGDGIYVGASNGTLWRSSDRGQNWTSIPTGGAMNSWYGLWGVPLGMAYSVGAGGSVIRVQ